MFLSMLLCLLMTGSTHAQMLLNSLPDSANATEMDNHPVQPDQEKAVITTIQQYSLAGDKQDLTMLDLVLHPTAQIHYQDENEVQVLDASTFRKLLSDGVIGGMPRNVTVENASIDGDLASAKARFESKAAIFDQYFSLLLVEGQWVIVGVIARMTPLK